MGGIVDAEGTPVKLTWLAGLQANTERSISGSDAYYKVHVIKRKIKIPLIDRKIDVDADGSFMLSGNTFQIPDQQDSYTLTNELEVKLPSPN